jgi:hypothetical protein
MDHPIGVIRSSHSLGGNHVAGDRQASSRLLPGRASATSPDTTPAATIESKASSQVTSSDPDAVYVDRLEEQVASQITRASAASLP